MAIHLLLHNIRSAHNVGAVFRSADAFGADKIWLTGYTPQPIDRHGRPRTDIAKTALGTEERVAWEARPRPQSVIRTMRAQGFAVVAVEQDEKAIPLSHHTSPPEQAGACFLMGNEVHGVSRALREQCDEIVEIPLHGEKESLNVSVAAGIILYHYTL